MGVSTNTSLPEEAPGLRIKIIFWILMGIFSVFFGEAVIGSTPFPYFTPAGWLIVFPVYELHIVVLGTIVFRYGKPNINVLFPAGMLFGMYEAYITKVLWGASDWSSNALMLGGFSFVAFPLIVLFWHPFFSFILALMASEFSLTSSRETLAGMPFFVKKKIKDRRGIRRSVLLFSLMLGLVWAAGGSPVIAFLSGISGISFLFVCIYLWRRILKGNRYSMEELLPGKKALRILVLLLIFMYVIFGLTLQPEAMAGAGTQILTGIIYILILTMLYVNLRKSRQGPAEKTAEPSGISYGLIAISSVIFIATMTLKTATGAGTVIFMITAVGGVGVGIVALLHSVGYAIKR